MIERDAGCESLWSEGTKAELETYVREGGGFVSVHAADNHDANWLEYNRMIGVGGCPVPGDRNCHSLGMEEAVPDATRASRAGRRGQHGA